jgi:hypothetical protein
MTTITLPPDQFAELRRLHEAAAAGPWKAEPQDGPRGNCTVAQVFGHDGYNVADLEPTFDPETASATAALIAAMRNALPALLAAVEPAAKPAIMSTQIVPSGQGFTFAVSIGMGTPIAQLSPDETLVLAKRALSFLSDWCGQRQAEAAHAVLRGEAIAVPRVATTAMLGEGLAELPDPDDNELCRADVADAWTAILTASPYYREPTAIEGDE